ncbi:MAG: phage Gp37/Gp68 family protein [Prosthecobacter sp.]
MAKNSSIEWTHHTFNPWWGCVKVSAACDNCYAETWAKRVGADVWGSQAKRRFFGDKHWSEPHVWNTNAALKKVRYRVFCASMADVFENRPELNEWRTRLWKLIEDTPNLDWLLLTKRPQNVAKMVSWGEDWPSNIWLGTTVENQNMAEKRIPHLLRMPAKVRFLSCEPLLGPIDLGHWKKTSERRIDWVIAGGESGPHSRPMHPLWAKKLRDHCAKNGIAFHFKQWGHWIPAAMLKTLNKTLKTQRIGNGRQAVDMIAVGKKEAGRILDGRTYDQFPLDTKAA